MSGTGVSQVVMTLSAPLLTRLYSPSDFGLYAIALTFYNLLSAVVCLRYELAIVLPRTQRSAANVMALCALVTLLVAGLSAVACLMVWAILLGGSGAGFEWWAALMIPISVLFCGLQQIVRYWCIRIRAFSVITNMVIVQAVVTVGVQILAGLLLAPHPAYLMLGTLLGLAAMLAAAVPQMAKVPRVLLAAVHPKRMGMAAKRHRHFPIFSSPYAFLFQASSRVILLVLAMFVSTATIGQFALAQRIVYLPISVLTASMSQVFYGRGAHSLDDPRLQQLVLRIIVAGALILVPLVAFNFVFAETVFGFVFGPAWAEAGEFAAYLGIAAGILTLTAWLDRVYDIRGRQQLSLVQEAVANIVILSALASAMYLTQDALAGIASYSLLMFAYCLVWTYVTFRVARFPAAYYGDLALAISAAASFAVFAIVLISFLTTNLLVQGLLFATLNAPVLFLGWRIARNGLDHLPTAIASFKI
jgi:O-antigen/teichoic acid export membrane protein